MATVIKWQTLIDFVGYWHRRNDDDSPERKDNTGRERLIRTRLIRSST